MIITLAGKNQLLLRRRLDRLVEQFLKDENELALERIDGSEADYGQILDAVSSTPFLADKKMVILRQLSANKRAAEKIEQLISAVSPTTQLIIVEPDVDRRTGYFKALKASTGLEEFDDLDAGNLPRWIVTEANSRGGGISHTDANYLVERVGTHQLMLASELEKLITFSPSINRDTIDQLTEKTPQSKTFDLLDAMFLGQKDKALRIYEEQRSQKVEPQAILALIAWQLNIIALAKWAADKSPAQIAKDAGLNPYPLGKAQRLAAKLPKDKINRMVNEAIDIDCRSKTEGIDLDEALRTYIVAL